MRDTGSGNGSAWSSLLLGTAAILMALFQPVNDATQRGFLVSTVGVTAIVYGMHALQKRRSGRATNANAPRVGIAFGTIGTAVMAYGFAAFMFALPSNPLAEVTAALHLPAMTAQAGSQASVQSRQVALAQPVAVPTSAPAPNPETATAPATRQQESAEVVQAAGTMSFVLRHLTPVGQPWPSALAVTTDNGRVMTPFGDVLGQVPTGGHLSYQPTADFRNYTLTITGSTFGVVAEFSTQSGAVTSH